MVTLTCQRIAIRDNDRHWQWFGPIVHFTLVGSLERPLPWWTATAVLESQCRDLVAQHGLAYFKDNAQIVEAHDEGTYDLIDLDEWE